MWIFDLFEVEIIKFLDFLLLLLVHERLCCKDNKDDDGMNDVDAIVLDTNGLVTNDANVELIDT